MAVRMRKVLPSYSAKLIVCTSLLNLVLIYMTLTEAFVLAIVSVRASLPKLEQEQQNRAETLAS